MAIASILNATKSFLSMLPEFATPNLTRIEDQFISTDDNGLTLLSGTEGNAPCEIIITCKNKKRRVTGLLSQGVKLTGQAEWKEMFGGGITSIGGSVISAVNSGMQAINGMSLQQPWMNRKFWNSTKPFSFTFSFNFISDKNSGKADVFLPAQTLLSFVYPRDLGTSEAIKEVLDRSGVIDTSQANTKGNSNVINATVDTFGKAFAIPGPAIAYSEKNVDPTKEYDGMGDYCTIVVGNLFAFGGVYIENVDVEFSPSMDSSGYPIWAKCTVKATAMDVNTCKTNGEFLISEFKDNQASLSALIDSIKVTASDAVKNIKNIAKTTSSAIGFTRNKE